MSTMMEATQQQVGQSSGVTSFPPVAMSYAIPRAGGRPIRFEGSELAMAMSYTSTLSYWYEINLYRTTDQRFVSVVKLFHQSPDKRDSARAWEHASLDDALDGLVGYDAGFDVPVECDLDAIKTPPSEVAALALTISARISDARHHYKSLVGEFLYDLEVGQ